MAVTILFVAANPNPAARLRLDEEVRRIQDKMRGAQYEKAVEMKAAWAARPDDLLRSLNQFTPDILHFSGHGNPGGELIFVDDQGHPKPVSEKALVAALKSAGASVQLAVLNACYSRQQADALVKVIPCALGMNAEIGDEAAITFSASFYRAIAYGTSVRQAFDQAIAALLLEGIPEESTPELLHRQGIDPGRLTFAGAERSSQRVQPGLELVDVGLVDDSRYAISDTDGVIHITPRRRV